MKGLNDLSVLQFLDLLRSGMCNTPPKIELFERNVEWNEINRYANQQAVLGLVFDGIQKLPKELMPKDESEFGLMNWIGETIIIENQNRLINEALAKITKTFKEQGLNPILLKGQGVAQYYQNPNRRTSGDIDLLFDETEYESAIRITKTWKGAIYDEPSSYHQGLWWNDVMIEIHKKAIDFFSSRNKRLLDETGFKIAWDNHEFKIPESDETIAIPSPTCNSIYLLLHLQHHLLQVGVGLRHVCDWINLWNAKSKEIVVEDFLFFLNHLPIKKTAIAIAWIGENYLGNSPAMIPLQTANRSAYHNGRILLSDILKMGNFGRASGMMDGFERNNHLGNYHTYFEAYKRQLKLIPFCPLEILNYQKHWFLSKLHLESY